MRSTTCSLGLSFVLLAASALGAQWDSIPWSGGAVLWRESYVAYPSAAGVHAFSAMGQRWELISPPGSTVAGQGDSLLVTREPGGALRGWSALRNDSALLALPPSATAIATSHTAVAWDPASGGNAVVHAYSPYLNAWTSLQAAQAAAAVQPAINGAVVAVNDGAGYHAYSARIGQWVTLPIVASGNPLVVGDLVLVDFDSGPGLNPQQIGAFSAHRGTWDVSDPYTTIVGPGLQFGTEVAVVRVKTADPARFAYSGFSALHGAWVTSSVTHAYTGGAGGGATPTTLVVVTDLGVATSHQVFAAGSGAWAGLSGANLQLFGTGADYAIVRDTVTGALHATSGLVTGGWSTAPVGPGATFVSTPDYAGLVHAGAGDWVYSATDNAWSGPLALPASPKYGLGESVFGFHATGATPRAYAARWSQWIPHPSAVSGVADAMLAQDSALVFAKKQGSNLDTLHPFDERTRRWGTPLAIGAIGTYKDFGARGTVVTTHPDFFSPNGSVYAWSGHRDDWSATAGVGPPVTAVTINGDVAWFRDQNQNLWAFGSRERTHVLSDWPDRPAYQASGPGPAGSPPPRLRVALRGQPGTDLLLAYAAVNLAPAPFAVPGVGGLAYLDPTGAFLVANLGTADADGVLNLAAPIGGAHMPGVSVWFQAVELDLGTLQASFAGRAAQAWIF